MNLFAMAGSLRSGSYNRKLIVLAVAEARALGVHVTLGDFRDFAPPLYDGDLETAQGLPPAAQALAHEIERADGIMIATPEYNNSIPGPLKNAIDWVSRLRPYRFIDKPVLLLGASAGRGGALKGMAALQIPLNVLGARIHPETFSVPVGGQAFDDNGRFVAPEMAPKLTRLVGEFIASITSRNVNSPESGRAP